MKHIHLLLAGLVCICILTLYAVAVVCGCLVSKLPWLSSSIHQYWQEHDSWKDYYCINAKSNPNSQGHPEHPLHTFQRQRQR